jgi:serine phosphatase RsbU (regulator of sigma subunit)
MSLRFKFLSLLVGLPSLCLGLFLYFAYNTFVEDKLLSIYDKQFQQLNFASMNLFGAEQDPNKMTERFDFLKGQEGFQTLMLVNNRGQVVRSAQQKVVDLSLEEIIGSQAFQKLQEQSAMEGSFEAKDIENERSLYAFSKSGEENNNLILLLSTELKGATRATMLFFLKSISALMALIGISIVVSLYFSKSVTSGISGLSLAMRAFGEGGEDVPLPISSNANDEIGGMAKSFSAMKMKINGLMLSLKENAGIETEMRLASELQTRFLPSGAKEFANTRIAFTFEPAEYAGGDWLFYFKKENYLFMIVADATGHGLMSAMLTAVSRSAISLAEEAASTPSECLRLLNKAIYSSVQNKLNMTCFLGALDINTGLVRYSSAAHEEPFIFPATDKKVKSSAIETLGSPAGKRLGEADDVTYVESEFQLNEGDTLFLYTDGLTDLKNPEGESLTERSLLRVVTKNINVRQGPKDIINWIDAAVKDHRKGAHLVDDLSYMAVQWKKP